MYWLQKTKLGVMFVLKDRSCYSYSLCCRCITKTAQQEINHYFQSL